MSSAPPSSRALRAAVLRILRALARVLLRQGMSCKSFLELAKRAYVAVAMEEFRVAGRKPSIARVAVLTGLTRKETQRLAGEGETEAADGDERYNRAARVIAGWTRDRAFQSPDGRARSLEIDEGRASFAALVRRHSGDMPARAVLDELLRVGAVEQTRDGRVRLLRRAYVPAHSDTDKLVILGTDVSALIESIDHNLEHGAEDPRFQRKVMYDNVPREAVAQFRALSAARGQALLEELDRWLARHDRDTTPAVEGSDAMEVGVGIFYFERSRTDGARKER